MFGGVSDELAFNRGKPLFASMMSGVRLARNRGKLQRRLAAKTLRKRVTSRIRSKAHRKGRQRLKPTADMYDGAVEHSSGVIAGLISRSDRVFFPTDRARGA
jgi:hypothetical protein